MKTEVKKQIKAKQIPQVNAVLQKSTKKRNKTKIRETATAKITKSYSLIMCYNYHSKLN